MRVLFVSTYFPGDSRILVHGVFKRMEMFVDAIKEIAQLDMLFYVPRNGDVSPQGVAGVERFLSERWSADVRLFLCPRFERPEGTSKWRRYGAGIVTVFGQGTCVFTSGSRQVEAFEACLRRKPDAIFAHRLPAMCPPLLTDRALPPICFDLDDVEHSVLVRSIGQQATARSKALSYMRLPALLWGERRAIRLADKTFVCSDLDRRYLTNYWRLPRVVTVPNAVELPECQPVAEQPTFLFVGSYLFVQNVYAADFLIQKIWPRVHRAMPAARLIIAGPAPERIPSYRAGVPGVEFTGFVDDLDALYRRSRVACAPIQCGGGTRIKIVEAAAYGKPIVATRIGAEGLELRDGHELLLRDDPESFANACLELLEDSSLCARLGLRARAKVEELYNRADIVRLIQGYLKDGNSN